MARVASRVAQCVSVYNVVYFVDEGLGIGHRTTGRRVYTGLGFRVGFSLV